ncbi:hypothetical protein AGOR_G00132780 [Albula goreensis]|uniref:Protein SSUH2 homolog n=1 Tax=Albula goreensis TaxID=1534307 RepID=A0A8T3D6S1_9TELE|nr:hypothetical protein AGOR_G00132780 [Albula goreensis]
MDKQPILSGHDYSYGAINTPATGNPAMYAPPAPGPTAPPANTYDVMPGYEGTVAGGEGGFLLPPSPEYPPPMPEQRPAQQDWTIPAISEDAAREALRSYVSSKCCYSDDPVKEGVITSIEPFNTYRYRLETFVESRSTEWAEQPYTGQQVDANLRHPPGPWDVQVQVPSMFQDGKHKVKVPYTSSVKPCHSCVGMGRRSCTHCGATGSKLCQMCNGTGFNNGSQCLSCRGRGRDRCFHCSGTGTSSCSTCNGKGQLLVYINLKVKWTNNLEDYVANQLSGLDAEKLKTVSGRELFRDVQYMVVTQLPLLEY